jgi:hypothetical protein
MLNKNESLTLKDMTRFMAIVANEKMFSQLQEQWVYHKINLIAYLMKKNEWEEVSFKQFSDILKSRNNVQLVGTTGIDMVDKSAVWLNDVLVAETDPIQIQMENILLGEWGPFQQIKDINEIKRKRENFSFLHIKKVIQYTFWISLVSSIGLLYKNGFSWIIFAKIVVSFFTVWLLQKIYIGVKEKIDEKKINKMMQVPDSIKDESDKYQELMDLFKQEISEQNLTSNEDVNKELRILKSQSLKLVLLMDKEKEKSYLYGDAWYDVRSMWKNDIPLLIDTTTYDDERQHQSIKITILAMQKVIQSYIEMVLENQTKPLNIQQKYWVAKASLSRNSML